MLSFKKSTDFWSVLFNKTFDQVTSVIVRLALAAALRTQLRRRFSQP